ncbi:MAG: Nif3-like dinuclear metal center hexameric protein [Clostridia bacterium]|nr:Nif3-like dinuclear metal center hexameric protein [Clostridia bacterium]MBQ8334553.1 Nif3-like dinuclear metal center hexameric protein [Clostridia bacterium]MBQ8369591.1 Nif3-like dinuclear metal center hexameric protein [Clostridia bacterium]
MTVNELHKALSEKYPKTLSCAWDNDGIMVSADTDAEVKRVLAALDATHETVKYAAANGFDTVVTHHPMLFKGAKSVTMANTSGRRILDAAKSGVSVLSFHTRLDAGEGGVNDCLCRACGMEPTEFFGDDEAPALGRIAVCEPMTARALAQLVKEKLGCDAVRLNGNPDRTVTRIGFCGGDGKDFIYPALSAGCDAFVTGDGGYNMAGDASEEGIVTIECGHYHSEAVVLAPLAERIRELSGAETVIYNSCTYTVI